VSLTDPELDLLLEILEDDPSDVVYVQVGEELVRRTRWADALRVLAQGVLLQDGLGTQTRALELLARVYLELGRFDEALSSLTKLSVDPSQHPERARVQILALERSGKLDQARESASRFLQVDGRDVVVRSVMERLAAPPPSPRDRAADPFYTAERAEQYAMLGRADRAVRVYRRILLKTASRSVEHRMRQLLTTASDVDDDLSAEITHPDQVPPAPEQLAPATPRIGTPTPVVREVAPEVAVVRDAAPPLPGAFDAPLPLDPPDDEDPTMRMDVTDFLKRYANGPYEEEDTMIDVSIVAAEEAPRPKRG
jgi:tetratricopeptide (TPR) repeat protein